MNNSIGKPFPIGMELPQHKQIAVVVTLVDPAEITFIVGEPDQVVLSKCELLTFDPGVVTDELLEERWNVMQTQPKDVLARMMVPDQTPDLPKVRCPVLGFWGIEDQFCPPAGYEKILRACPGSRFEMLSQCGHWAMAEYPALFNRSVIEFLNG